jgi:hypothetical protein
MPTMRTLPSLVRVTVTLAMVAPVTAIPDTAALAMVIPAMAVPVTAILVTLDTVAPIILDSPAILAIRV